MTDFETRLKAFQTENNIFSKGKLSVVIQFTRLVRGKEFPLNPDDFKTVKEGQVAGLGGGNLKKILKDHGIAQQLSAEGGRTSRGSMGLMIEYVDFLNGTLKKLSTLLPLKHFGLNKCESISETNLLFLQPIHRKPSDQIWIICLNRRRSVKSRALGRSIWVLCFNIWWLQSSA